MAHFSNRTEEDLLYAQCAECLVGKNPDVPCPVLFLQSKYNHEQLARGQKKLSACLSSLVDTKGKCLMKKNITKALGHRDPDAPLRVMPSMLEWAKARGVNVI
jgi:hypothetical protein